MLIRTTHCRATVESWSFALGAVGFPHRIVTTGDGQWGIWVDPGLHERAGATLDTFDREESERIEPREPRTLDHGSSFAGVAMAVGLVAFFGVTGGRAGGDPGGWMAAGSATADRIVHGQWWRVVTALCLHADGSHVLGNAAASIIFVTPNGRWLGDGLALLLVLAAGALGNLTTAYIYGGGHDAIGASTATFGALGILGGLQIVRWWRGQAWRADRRRKILTVVAACLGLFAMLGVGEHSDVMAHATGLAWGLVLGAAAGRAVVRELPRAFSHLLVAVAVAAVAGCWGLALLRT